MNIAIMGLVVASVALATGGCTARQVVENTGDALVGTAKIAGRGVVGAGRLAGRGTVAGVRRLNRARPGYQAGEEVCVSETGEVLGALREVDGQPTCVIPSAVGPAA